MCFYLMLDSCEMSETVVLYTVWCQHAEELFCRLVKMTIMEQTIAIGFLEGLVASWKSNNKCAFEVSTPQHSQHPPYSTAIAQTKSEDMTGTTSHHMDPASFNDNPSDILSAEADVKTEEEYDDLTQPAIDIKEEMVDPEFNIEMDPQDDDHPGDDNHPDDDDDPGDDDYQEYDLDSDLKLDTVNDEQSGIQTRTAPKRNRKRNKKKATKAENNSETDLIATGSINTRTEDDEHPEENSKVGDDTFVCSTEEDNGVIPRNKQPKYEQQCEQCGQVFRNKSHYSTHKKRHEGKLDCPKCDLQLTSGKNLKLHLEAAHDCKEYSCDVCGKTFKTLYQLWRHLKTHEDNPSLKCPDCGLQCSCQSRLQYHALKHQKVYSLKCNFCPKLCREEHTKKQHQLICSNNPEKSIGIFVCPTCGKRFNYKGNLKQHQLTHTKYSMQYD